MKLNIQPAPWSFDEYGNLKDADQEIIVLTGCCLNTGRYRVPNTPLENTKLLQMAPEMYEAMYKVVAAVDDMPEFNIDDKHIINLFNAVRRVRRVLRELEVG